MKSTTPRSNPTDPNQVLPEEMFNECLSLLPPAAIHISAAVNQEWKRFIFSHLLLHTEVDLSHLGVKWYQSRQKRLMAQKLAHSCNTFRRLSLIPATNRLTKISINLSVLWSEFLIRHFKGNRNEEVLDFFVETFQLSQNSLKEVRFFFDGEESSLKDLKGDHIYGTRFGRRDDPLEFIVHLIERFENFIHFTSFRSIWIQAPINFEIKAGDSTSKSFLLTPLIPTRECEFGEPELSIVQMMEIAIDLVGEEVGLTEFRSAHEFWGHSFEIFTRGLTELAHDTLQILEIDPCGLSDEMYALIWNFASTASRLTTFSFHWNDWWFQEPDELQLPERTNKATLKNIKFGCILEEVHSDAMQEWIGDSVECLEIFVQVNEDGPYDDYVPLGIVFNCREALRTLILDFYDDVPATEIQVPLVFPNLESLSLSVAMEITELFSQFEFPRLHTFKIDQYNTETNFDLIYSFLDKLSSRLTHLTFFADVKAWSSDVPQLSFPNLKHLDLSDCKRCHRSWFSSLLYPSLLSFSRPEDSSSFLPRVFQDQSLENQVYWKENINASSLVLATPLVRGRYRRVRIWERRMET